ncbi:hypothetical protein PNP85_06280, partial [Halobacterium salinarum]|uniref:hypothetical protein n=1 Tax=Halobacterium salinarum TaxID=2242 RepID=UPI002555E6C6
MAEFIEPLLKERVWHWLESNRGMEVDGEIRIDNGRIDLVGKSSDDHVIGIELKQNGLSVQGQEFEQMQRYIDSGELDELYFASNRVEGMQSALMDGSGVSRTTLATACRRLRAGVDEDLYTLEDIQNRITSKLPAEFLETRITGSGGVSNVEQYINQKVSGSEEDQLSSIDLDEGVAMLGRSSCPTEIGVIHVPLNLDSSIESSNLRDLDQTLDPEKVYEPQVLREANQLTRTSQPGFNRAGEPWVRHCVWREFGGLPEGYIPNVMDSDQPYRPIDLIAFRGSYDPTDAVATPESNEILGIEAKGKTSFGDSRVEQQLSEFLETATLSRLYLAVPASVSDRAMERLSNNDELSQVGLLTVAQDGTVETIQEAKKRRPEYDGYLNRYSKKKTGFGSVEIPDGKDVRSPFLTEEAADRVANKNAEDYASDLLTDNSDLADDSGWITTDPPTEKRSPISDYDSVNEARYGFSDTIRSYLLRGRSADPYGAHGEDPIPKEGYVRLRIEELEDDEQTPLKFHFGRGSGEGGYIWFDSTQIDTLFSVLVSIDTVSGGTIHGQGKVIDLQEFPFEHGENKSHKLTGDHGQEEILSLSITPVNPHQAPDGHILPPCHEKTTG